MEKNFLAKKIKYTEDSTNKNKGLIEIEPCYPGYGITWGNAIRRVLLSSLEGSAVTCIKIKGTKHEFSVIDNIKEDVMEIILNLKLLRFKILKNQDEPIKLTLSVKGEKKVLGKDINESLSAEVVNKDLVIANLTDKQAKLDIDIWVEKGYGWVSSEDKSRQGLDVGVIVVDSIFSPILNVGLNIDDVRVGKRTDFDKISLRIETDGIISPIDAFLKASKLLSSQFDFFINLTNSEDEKPKKVVKKIAKKVPVKKKVVKKAVKKVPVKKKVVKKAVKKKTIKKK